MDKEPKTLADKLADLLLIEALSARMGTLTVRLAELEMWKKQHE